MAFELAAALSRDEGQRHQGPLGYGRFVAGVWLFDGARCVAWSSPSSGVLRVFTLPAA